MVIDQVFFSTISDARTVHSIYKDAKKVIEALVQKGYDKPVLMQFDAIDPETGYVVSTVTNARVQVKKDAKGVITESEF